MPLKSLETFRPRRTNIATDVSPPTLTRLKGALSSTFEPMGVYKAPGRFGGLRGEGIARSYPESGEPRDADQSRASFGPAKAALARARVSKLYPRTRARAPCQPQRGGRWKRKFQKSTRGRKPFFSPRRRPPPTRRPVRHIAGRHEVWRRLYRRSPSTPHGHATTLEPNNIISFCCHSYCHCYFYGRCKYCIVRTRGSCACTAA